MPWWRRVSAKRCDWRLLKNSHHPCFLSAFVLEEGDRHANFLNENSLCVCVCVCQSLASSLYMLTMINRAVKRSSAEWARQTRGWSGEETICNMFHINKCLRRVSELKSDLRPDDWFTGRLWTGRKSSALNVSAGKVLCLRESSFLMWIIYCCLGFLWFLVRLIRHEITGR